jgi:hypothetical protein
MMKIRGEINNELEKNGYSGISKWPSDIPKPT